MKYITKKYLIICYKKLIKTKILYFILSKSLASLFFFFWLGKEEKMTQMSAYEPFTNSNSNVQLQKLIIKVTFSCKIMQKEETIGLHTDKVINFIFIFFYKVINFSYKFLNGNNIRNNNSK